MLVVIPNHRTITRMQEHLTIAFYMRSFSRIHRRRQTQCRRVELARGKIWIGLDIPRGHRGSKCTGYFRSCHGE